MKRYFPLFFIILFFSVFPLAADDIPPFVMPSSRASGFGGIHVAMGDDFSSIFSNPASFAGIKKQLSVAEITVGVYGPVFELLDTAVAEGGDVTQVINSENFTAGFDIGGPISVGLVNNGFGVGFFNRSVLDIKTVAASSFIPGFVPVPGVIDDFYIMIPKAWEEILFVGGYSFRVLDRRNFSFDIGILGKAFYRTMLDLQANADDLYALVGDAFDMPLQTHFGVGLDLGLRFCIADFLSLGLVYYDVYSPALVTEYASFSDYGGSGTQSYAVVQPRLALGVLYRFKNNFLERYISDIVLMADYRDFFDLFKNQDRNGLLNLTLGIEITMLKILKLRAGMSEILPSGGFGIDMTFLTMDVAVRGKQMGNKPGEKTVFAFDFGLLFRY